MPFDRAAVTRHTRHMAKEKVYSEVLNLRIDPALSSEVKRIAAAHETTESDAARRLLVWGVEAHRAVEASELLRRYDAPEPDFPTRMRVSVFREEVDPAEWDGDPGLVW